MNQKSVLNLISEAGTLKRVKRSGWWVVGIKDPESVAEHSFRCAIISYVIARMEKVAPYKAILMAIFNDMHEARINDLHKMAQRYVKFEEAENRAFFEQVNSLPQIMKSELISMRNEYNNQNTKESVIARDADILECLIQAKEYYEYGFKEARKFMKKAPQFFKTKSAKTLWSLARASDLNTWWERLSDFKR